MAAVTHAFQKDTNNLHHRQLVCAHLFSFLLQSRFSFFFNHLTCCGKNTHIFFPILQKLVQDDAHSGHYFMIVLNLRNERFELIDSLRTLGDPKLAECCNKVLSGIKFLWNIYYGDSDYAIDDYELVDIAVPKQTNM